MEVQRELEARQEEVERLQARVSQLEGGLAQGGFGGGWVVSSGGSQGPVETLEAKVRAVVHQSERQGGKRCCFRLSSFSKI